MQFRITNEFDFEMEIETHLKISLVFILTRLSTMQRLFDILYIARENEIANKKRETHVMKKRNNGKKNRDGKTKSTWIDIYVI